MIRFTLRFLCSALEWLCCLTHPFWRIEIWITGRYCNLCDLSVWLNDKYNLDIWKEPDEMCPTWGKVHYETESIRSS